MLKSSRMITAYIIITSLFDLLSFRAPLLFHGNMLQNESLRSLLSQYHNAVSKYNTFLNTDSPSEITNVTHGSTFVFVVVLLHLLLQFLKYGFLRTPVQNCSTVRKMTGSQGYARAFSFGCECVEHRILLSSTLSLSGSCCSNDISVSTQNEKSKHF